MKEANVRHMLIEKFEKQADCCAIENEAGSGIPDLNVCYKGKDFWIEIKYREELPKRISTPALGKALRPSQRIWFKRRIAKEATNLFLFIRIDDELFLVHVFNEEILEAVEEANIHTLQSMTCWHGFVRHKPDWEKALATMWGLS